jgi:hypothetical protein
MKAADHDVVLLLPPDTPFCTLTVLLKGQHLGSGTIAKINTLLDSHPDRVVIVTLTRDPQHFWHAVQEYQQGRGGVS